MSEYKPIDPEIEQIAKVVVDAVFTVHKTLGPGLLETIYEACLLYELQKRKVSIESQVAVPITYDKLKLDSGLRLDLIVEKAIVLELKAVEKLLPIHEAQLLTYLKLTNLRLGFLINFNVEAIRLGIKRIIR